LMTWIWMFLARLTRRCTHNLRGGEGEERSQLLMRRAVVVRRVVDKLGQGAWSREGQFWAKKAALLVKLVV